jgi:hypothetical protein
MAKKNYWCYRIDNNYPEFFWKELLVGRLRQGWGWDEGQDLNNFTIDEGAGRNRPMLNVEKGDVLLIPHLPDWDDIAIVEATENWREGYKFEIDEDMEDYGHIFPAHYIKKFTRNNEYVTGNIRSTLKNPSRFWNINHYGKDVEKLLKTDVTDLSKSQDYESRLETSIEVVFNEMFKTKEFSENLYRKLNEQFTREEWEFALVHGLRKIFPFYKIERVGGYSESEHGTDILIKMPSIILDFEYAVAIQVKDYEGFVADDVIKQINKAEKYWNNENIRLVEKIVIITRSDKDDNLHLLENKNNVKFIFANELTELLSNMGKAFIGIKSY